MPDITGGSSPPPPYSSLSRTVHRQGPSLESPQPSDQNDMSWLDFLRTAGGTAHDPDSSAPTSAAQTPQTSIARRAVHSEDGFPQVRAVAESTTNERDSQGAHVSAQAAITSPGHLSIAGDLTRRESDTSLPKWQPDSEVSECPVCGTEFTFWYRKHHCRKCGRVVCSACSPHRITIPREYVVYAPSSMDGDYAFGSSHSTLATNLGGGEIVRVCNPCVPDPWTPSANSTPNKDVAVNTTDNSHLGISDLHRANAATAEGERGFPIPIPPAFQQRPTRHRPIIPASHATAGRSRSHSHQVPSTFSRSVPHPVTHRESRLPIGFGTASTDASTSTIRRHRYTTSNNTFLVRHGGSPQSGSVAVSSHPLPQLPPPRQIREEDECPVCGREMLLGDDVREAHVQSCIASRFSSSQPSTTPPGELPISADTDAAHVVRARTASFRSRGMAVYRATEKDCATENGDPQECIICFEDFQPGDEMGRMECLCKFHRTCIRQWWQTKGPGSCPTHQLQE